MSTASNSQGLENITKLCDNATPVNKAVAKQAGYDLDELCGEFTDNFRSNSLSAPVSPPVARETVSSTEKVADMVAPVAVKGVGNIVSAAELKPFGYDLFANAPTTFAPAASIPVSGDYLLGPGDSLDILFYGKVNSAFSITINREGLLIFQS